MSDKTFAVGDLVTPDPDLFANATGVFKIEKAPRTAREKNYTAVPVNPETGERIPGLRGIKGPAHALNAYDPNATVEQVEYLPIPPNSSIVTVTGHHSIKDGDLYVVIGLAQKSLTAVRLQKVGGDGGRYWKSVPVRMLTVIDPARITVTPEPANS